jgi:hypothetical protein
MWNLNLISSKYKVVFIMQLFFILSNSLSGQDKILSLLKKSNEDGDYQKSREKIALYKSKNYDTTKFDFLVSLADYHSIFNNTEYDPFRSLTIVNNINCENIFYDRESLYFEGDKTCSVFLEYRKEIFSAKCIEVIKKTDDIKTLESFKRSYIVTIQVRDNIDEKLIGIHFNSAKISNSKEKLLKFIGDYPSSIFENEAKKIIEDLDYLVVCKNNTKESYISFLSAYPNSQYFLTIKDKLEKIEFDNTLAVGTLAAFSVFINAYPGSKNSDEIIKKMEDLSWNECLRINSPSAFREFTVKYPNSKNLIEAKQRLTELERLFDIGLSRSVISLAKNKNEIIPYILSKGKVLTVDCEILLISKKNKVALGIKSSNIGEGGQEAQVKVGYILSLIDGIVLFEFKYITISNCVLNDDEGMLYYHDDGFVKVIDLKEFSVSSIFEVEVSESNRYSYNNQSKKNLYLDDSLNLNFCFDASHPTEWPQRRIFHIVFNTVTKNKKIIVFDGFPSAIRGDLQKEYSFLSGSHRTKLEFLKVVYGDNFQFKLLNKNSKQDYLVINFPEIMILQNDRFTHAQRFNFFRIDSVTKEMKPFKIDRSVNAYGHGGFQQIQLTQKNRLLFADKSSVFILDLSKKLEILTMNDIQINQINPLEIKTDKISKYSDPNYIVKFAYFDEQSLNIFIDLKNDRPCLNHLIYNVKEYFSSTKSSKLQSDLLTKMRTMDSILFQQYDAVINKKIIENVPFENDIEKYERICVLDSQNNRFHRRVYDSLVSCIQKIIIDSMVTFQYKTEIVFSLKNYNRTTQAWRLPFENPYGGKDFALFYDQPLEVARAHHASNYSNMTISVTYYFNLISLQFEPLLVDIKDNANLMEQRFFIAFKDERLIKNLFLINNSLLAEFRSPSDCSDKEIFQILPDDYLMRYFVRMGKPKYYFDYGVRLTGMRNEDPVRIKDLGDPGFSETFQDVFVECCPPEIIPNGYEANPQFLRFDDVPYFIKSSRSYPDFNSTSVFAIGKKVELLKRNGVDYNKGRSPDGKYYFSNQSLYYNQNCIIKFRNVTGLVYYDCNSLFLGLGENLLPIGVIQALL